MGKPLGQESQDLLLPGSVVLGILFSFPKSLSLSLSLHYLRRNEGE